MNHSEQPAPRQPVVNCPILGFGQAVSECDLSDKQFRLGLRHEDQTDPSDADETAAITAHLHQRNTQMNAASDFITRLSTIVEDAVRERMSGGRR
ncbi:hypothetical protein [Pseudomonas asplenii]|uniref:hypothetical protein n=1 Tax=Pseudomonas asplenii TaxID=53407 RepID=UPI001E5FE7BC|nr:hypothetical protein [Pseudomonas fuscovaginae]